MDREATIDKAKFVKNEQRLRIANAELLEIVRRQDSIIGKVTEENINALRQIQIQNQRIFELSQDISRLSDLQLEYEERKTKTPKLYAYGGLDYDPERKVNLPHVGVAYFFGAFGIGANIGLIERSTYYGGKVFISIF